MRFIHKPQDLRQLPQSQVGIQQIIHGLANAHFVQKIKKGQPRHLCDMRADGRFTVVKLLRDLLERQLFIAVQIHITQNVHGIHAFAAPALRLLRCRARKNDRQIHDQIQNRNVFQFFFRVQVLA